MLEAQTAGKTMRKGEGEGLLLLPPPGPQARCHHATRQARHQKLRGGCLWHDGVGDPRDGSRRWRGGARRLLGARVAAARSEGEERAAVVAIGVVVGGESLAVEGAGVGVCVEERLGAGEVVVGGGDH
eukprot:scaffold224083_cov26-Tisochrysis_lutea.AAC.1